MKIHTYYECEICNLRHSSRSSAEACEARGKQPLVPVGLIFGDFTPGAFYKGITFCVARVKQETHGLDVGMWAARDNGAGDNYGDELCGGMSFRLNEDDAPNPHAATFKRMVKWIKANRPDIKITVWNGIAAVPLKTFLKEHKI